MHTELGAVQLNITLEGPDAAAKSLIDSIEYSQLSSSIEAESSKLSAHESVQPEQDKSSLLESSSQIPHSSTYESPLQSPAQSSIASPKHSLHNLDLHYLHHTHHSHLQLQHHHIRQNNHHINNYHHLR